MRIKNKIELVLNLLYYTTLRMQNNPNKTNLPHLTLRRRTFRETKGLTKGKSSQVSTFTNCQELVINVTIISIQIAALPLNI